MHYTRICICYNSCVGTQMHLFDIDIPGKIKFKESDTLTGGSELFTFDTGIVRTPIFSVFHPMLFFDRVV